MREPQVRARSATVNVDLRRERRAQIKTGHSKSVHSLEAVLRTGIRRCLDLVASGAQQLTCMIPTQLYLLHHSRNPKCAQMGETFSAL